MQAAVHVFPLLHGHRPGHNAELWLQTDSQPTNHPPTRPQLTGREINVPFEFLHSSTHFCFPQHLFTHVSDNVCHKFVCDARTRFLNQVECISQFINCLHFLWRTYHLVTFTELQREKIKKFLNASHNTEYRKNPLMFGKK